MGGMDAVDHFLLTRCLIPHWVHRAERARGVGGKQERTRGRGVDKKQLLRLDGCDARLDDPCVAGSVVEREGDWDRESVSLGLFCVCARATAPSIFQWGSGCPRRNTERGQRECEVKCALFVHTHIHTSQPSHQSTSRKGKDRGFLGTPTKAWSKQGACSVTRTCQ